MTTVPDYSAAIAESVLNGSLPRYWYKYRKFSNSDGTDIHPRCKDIIERNSLYFASRDSFNDPFDFNFQISIDDATDSQIEELCRNILIDRFGPSLSPQDSLNFHTKAKNDRSWLFNNIRSNAISIKKDTGICCFNATSDNILLWSYYADHHRGVCFKFDILRDLEFFQTPLEMKYQEEYPTLTIPDLISDRLQEKLCAKAKIWFHEEEYRLIKYNKFEHQPFKKEALVEVIFGCNADEVLISKFRQLVYGNQYSHVGIRKMKISETEFKLYITDPYSTQVPVDTNHNRE